MRLTWDHERYFLEHIHDLRVFYSDFLVQVTEYVLQIVTFVEEIVENGPGCSISDGMVNFDVYAFEKAGHHDARLKSWNRCDKLLLADGERSSSETSLRQKENYFALGKVSMRGEPPWPNK